MIDSVTRQWIEKAKQTGQALIGSAAAPGTYASGVHKMTEVLPGLMSDIIVTAPESQKVSTMCSCSGLHLCLHISRGNQESLELILSILTIISSICCHCSSNHSHFSSLQEKIAKLIDIWGAANTFPADMLSDFKRKLQGPTQSKPNDCSTSNTMANFV